MNPWQKEAKDEVRKYLERGALGMKLHPVRDSYSLASHELVDPLFEVCSDFKVPIRCHGMDEWSNTP